MCCATKVADEILVKKKASPETDTREDNTAGSNAKDGSEDVEQKKQYAVMDVDDDEEVSCSSKMIFLCF